MEYIKEPEQIGEILRELFIVREDGSVDHDMVVALARAVAVNENRPHLPITH